jgi:hypothetical protein
MLNDLNDGSFFLKHLSGSQYSQADAHQDHAQHRNPFRQDGSGDNSSLMLDRFKKSYTVYSHKQSNSNLT